MTPEKEEKFEENKKRSTLDVISNIIKYEAIENAGGVGWAEHAAKAILEWLEANGIGFTESSAPAWVIYMMRTGKPVRCEVANDEEELERKCYVTGYDIKAVDSFSDEYGTTWKYARPIPAWKPQDGEAVFFQCDTVGHVGRVIENIVNDGFYYGLRASDGEYLTRSIAGVKPFDASKIGKPWSEI